MAPLLAFDWQKLLELINSVLASGIVIFSCALLLYLMAYGFRSRVSRSFATLLACVLIVYFVDLALLGVESLDAAAPWLRLQWLGIAFTPAAYLGFSNALLISTGARSRPRDAAVKVSYGLSTLVLLTAAFSDLLVHDGELTIRAAHLDPGPLFPLFALYFLTGVIWGGLNVLWARRRCLTSTSRRRMNYLVATFAAPAAGIFPYLLLTGLPGFTSAVVLWLLLVLSNVAIGLMLVLLAYSVAFFGAFTSDRVVKHRLVRFLLRGPLLATLVVIVIIVSSQTESWLGLPGRRAMLFGVVGAILFLQLGVEFFKPVIDRALYREDHYEIERIQQLSNRLLTTTDLRQFLENVLTALCDLLRVESAFVVALDHGKPHLEVVCGTLEPETADQIPPEAWRQAHTSTNGAETSAKSVARSGDLFVWNGYWLVPLHANGQAGATIGVVGLTARSPEPDLTDDERAGMEVLLDQAMVALVDRQLQQGIFDALESILPEIEDIQRRRGMVHYVGQDALEGFSRIEGAEFRVWVRDALSHYWGGPKLIDSPLLGLNVVATAAQEYEGNAMQGLRVVLKQAIESLRPNGQRQMTTPEWILYNILELKFLQGHKVR
ncbi:MAG: hypothetical protein GX620_02640, partial [Chloroflexi bacterium]|nr:hypothetical protein [Chloroflexota bacterium]